MKKLILNLLGSLLVIFGLASCETEPDLAERGRIRVPAEDGCVLTYKNTNLLTLAFDYPILKVSSIYSLTSSAPEIAYLGQFHDLVEIPMQTEGNFSTQAVIHNCGGYIIRMQLIRPGTNGTEQCIVKLLVKEGPFYEDDSPDYLDVEYEIYK